MELKNNTAVTLTHRSTLREDLRGMGLGLIYNGIIIVVCALLFVQGVRYSYRLADAHFDRALATAQAQGVPVQLNTGRPLLGR